MIKKYEKSSFPYWFRHWCAFQMVALNLGVWKPKHLLHDWEKPWLLLFYGDYKKVQKQHRENSKHHHQYYNFNKIDWEAMVIDWECSRFTKPQAPLTARETMEQLHPELTKYVKPIIDKLGL